MVKKFQKRQEDFVCEQCGAAVKGDGYTDHCPVCLFGKHVDIFPGDRLEECHGILVPIGLTTKKGGQVIEYQCEKCHEKMSNRAADNDSPETLVALAQQLADAVHKTGRRSA